MRTAVLTLLALPALIGMAALAAPAKGGAGGTGSGAPAAGQPPPAAAGAEVRPVADIERRVLQFSPTPLSADLSALGEQERRALAELVEAARPLDQIFLRQASTSNPDLRRQLAAYRGLHAAATLAYFDINFGPWDRLAEWQPFVGDRPRPAGAGSYPEDLTREAFEGWLAKHPGDRASFTSTTTVVRRGRRGGGGSGQGAELIAVPYSREYEAWLGPAADHLRQAAAMTGNASLKRFLTSRAAAFASDDYYASDMDWMDLDSPIEITIGPYETYEDTLFGYKAAFEAYVTVALTAESAALARYKERLPWLERNLPIPDAWKNLGRGTASPIRVVDLVYGAGEAQAAVQTLAFNLPNDERVREAKGSKKVLLRNVMRAKYDQILLPIARQVLDPAQLRDVAFEAYFDHVLHHELGHGLGPGSITVDGRKTEVRLELKELYSTLEEAKADVMGVFDILALVERGEMPAELRRTLEPTYVAGLFRAARFGLTEAHGQGVVAQFNYLMAKGALAVDAANRFHAVPEKFPGAIRDLLAEMLTLQAKGDYAGTRKFLETYGKASPSLVAAVARLGGVPVDIRPIYSPPAPSS
jgi:peptidase M49-like protein